MGKKQRIGIFVCHCGLNIAGAVDMERVMEELSHYPGIAHIDHYIYMCSDPGQELVRNAIREKSLNAIVMANCSPALHEQTFRRLAKAENLNPYLCEIANIREQCSWPHARHKQAATKKAINIIKTAIEKLRMNMELSSILVPLTRRALVIGSGPAGMQAALDIANGGFEVVVVERSPSIGGHIPLLSSTFPTLDRASCLANPLMAQLEAHPNIKIYAYSQVEQVSGYVGNFVAKIRKWATFVEGENGNGCRACEEICPEEAIDFSQQDTLVEEPVGSIVVATGYSLISKDVASEYASDPDVIDGLAFERILSPTGPTGGKVKRPSDGKVAKEVVFIQCVGSRDPERGVPYCSRVCCLYTAKQAALYKHAVADGQAYVFYMDIRSDVRGCEEFVQRVIDEDRVLYIRGRVSKVFRDGDKLRVWGTDTLIGKEIEISADLVVLALAMVPSPGAMELAKELGIIHDQQGFLTEAHPKLRPVETLTSGIYIAGAAQWPKDLPDTISSASGAASKVLSLFSREEFLREPVIAFVDEEVCRGCGQCVSICTYQAIALSPKRKIAKVNEAVCEGCGACAVTCPSKAIKHKNWTPKQFLEMIDVAVEEYA